MKRQRRSERPTAPEAIARMADRGENVSRFFTNKGRMMPAAVQRVNVDFTLAMLGELDEVARALNISRQAVIKTIVREGLDRHYLAQQGRRAG
jgi:hypothetical protein